MVNYKALGIEKEINEEFRKTNQSDLSLLLNSCYFDNPYIERRRNEGVYCMIEVADCQHPTHWYANLIGLTFFCEIRYSTWNDIKVVRDFVGVKLTKTKRIVFRGFDPKDVIMI